VTDLE